MKLCMKEEREKIKAIQMGNLRGRVRVRSDGMRNERIRAGWRSQRNEVISTMKWYGPQKE